MGLDLWEKKKLFFDTHLDLSKSILEIAPYFNPMVSKSKANVLYTDYIGNDEIQRKALENPGSVGKEIPLVDFVWTPGARLRDCAPHGEFDFVVASHVLEHVPNPVGWLNELLSVLKIGGSVLLILPDRRASFDYYRREASFAEVAALAIQQPAIPTTAQLLDFMTRGIYDDGVVGTRPYEKGLPFEAARRPYTDADAINTAIWSLTTNSYLDAHCTVWTAESFSEVFNQVIASGLMNISMSQPVENFSEFLVKLTKLGEPRVVPPPSVRPPTPNTPVSRTSATAKRILSKAKSLVSSFRA